MSADLIRRAGEDRLTALAEEQLDASGDLCWVLTIRAITHDRAALDRLADAAGARLEFTPVGRSAS